jgi:hypothetical protein
MQQMGGVMDAIPLEPVLVLGAMGEIQSENVDYSHNLIEGMPPGLVEAIHDPFSARAVVFAMLLDDDEEICGNQLRIISDMEGDPTENESRKLSPLVNQSGRESRLPIVEMVQSSLTEMSEPQYQRFKKTVDELVKADGKIDLFEFMLQRVLIDHLDRQFYGKKPPAMKYHSLNAVMTEVGGLISCLAHVGHTDADETQNAYSQATGTLSGQAPDLMSKRDCSLNVVSQSLDKLAQSSPAVKKQVLNAAMTCIAADGKVTVAEAELVRAVADSLDCPIPPITVGPLENSTA